MARVSEAFVDSRKTDGKEAAEKLVERALRKQDFDSPDFAFLFCSKNFKIKQFAPHVGRKIEALGAEMVGCTTAGEISNHGATTKCATLMLIESEEIEFTVGKSNNIYENPEKTGKRALEQIKHSQKDGKKPNNLIFALTAAGRPKRKASEFGVLKGITKNLEEDIPIVGGSAGDDLRGKRTYQFHNQDVSQDSAILVKISSNLPIEVGHEHGMDGVRGSGVINETGENEIKEIKGEKAARFYADNLDQEIRDISDIKTNKILKPVVKAKRFLKLKYNGESMLKMNKLFQYSVQNPLAAKISKDSVRIISPLDVTENEGLEISSDVKKSQVINIAEGSKEDIVLAGKKAFDNLEKENEPLFGVVANSVIRNHMFTRNELEKEVGEMRKTVSAPIIGFYGYGQIGPNDANFSTFNNQSIAGFVIYKNEF